MKDKINIENNGNIEQFGIDSKNIKNVNNKVIFYKNVVFWKGFISGVITSFLGSLLSQKARSLI
jgi:hypothetical protein